MVAARVVSWAMLHRAIHEQHQTFLRGDGFSGMFKPVACCWYFGELGERDDIWPKYVPSTVTLSGFILRPEITPPKISGPEIDRQSTLNCFWMPFGIPFLCILGGNAAGLMARAVLR